MTQFYRVKVGNRCLEELWGKKETWDFNKQRRITKFRCPRCCFLTSSLGAEHNCTVSDWQPYNCLSCDKTVYPPNTFLAELGANFYFCLWCGGKLPNARYHHVNHAWQCCNKPRGDICACAYSSCFIPSCEKPTWLLIPEKGDKMESQVVLESQGDVQYRWVLIHYHAGSESDRAYGDIWYDSKEECQQAADSLDFDYCCGFSFEFESRHKPQ